MYFYEKYKKILVAISISVICVGIPASATIISNQQIPLIYDPSTNYAQQCDNYVTANTSGTMHESHNYSGLTPTSFHCDLELRTAWYLPNQVMDTSYNPWSYNQTSCSANQQFRTFAYANGNSLWSPHRTDLYTSYDNY